MPTSPAARWVLLIHQIPPKPDYFRVKVWRRLQRLAAVAIKNSVYVLPRADETVEDLQWQTREIVADGGEASVCEATFVDGLRDTEIEALFRTPHSAPSPGSCTTSTVRRRSSGGPKRPGSSGSSLGSRNSTRRTPRGSSLA